MADSRLLTLWFQEARICNTVWCYWRLDVALITATEAGGGKGVGGRGGKGVDRVVLGMSHWRLLSQSDVCSPNAGPSGPCIPVGPAVAVFG